MRLGGRCHDRIHRTDRADEFDVAHSGFFLNSSLAPVLRFRRSFVSVSPRLPSEYGLHHCSLYSLVSPFGVTCWYFPLNSMLIISSVPLMMLILSWLLLSILFLMFVLLVRRLLLASVSSKAGRRRMTAWRNRNEGCFWAVKLDVRDLGGHLDVTLRAVAGTLTNRVKIATTQVPAVGAFPLGFNACLEWCDQNTCLVVFMVVKVLLYLSLLSVLFVLRSPELFGLRNFP